MDFHFRNLGKNIPIKSSVTVKNRNVLETFTHSHCVRHYITEYWIITPLKSTMAKSEESKCYGFNHRSGFMFPVLVAMGGLVDCFQSFCRLKCMGITVVAAAGPEEEEISHC